MQVDELRERRFHGGKLLQRSAECLERFRRGRLGRGGTGTGRALRALVWEGNEVKFTASLLRLTTARVVDREPTHRARRIREEVRAVGELRSIAVGEPEVRLME